MVWGLFPVHPNSGEEKYYIYTKGTYKVGRKGCDVTIGNDKSVSRIHAEIILDPVESLEHVGNRSSYFSSNVRIKDCSKYGTYFERNSSTKEKVRDCPGNETYLKDGDLVSFGTGNATYRFSYVPLIFYLCNFTSSQGTPSAQDTVSSIGARVAYKWTTECTHVIVDPFTPVTEEIIDIILANKPLVLSTWLELVAACRLNNEIPSYSQYIPTLTLDGGSVTIADTRTRENCLKGYTFVLGSANKYRFQDRMQSLLEVAGAEVILVGDFDSRSQGRTDKDNLLVLVIPADSTEQFCLNSSLCKVNEINLVSAAISGHLDASILISPSIVVSSSCSTDETIVADSDAETDTETATSDHPAITNIVVENASHDSERQTFRKQTGSLSEDTLAADITLLNNSKLIRGKEASECKYEEKIVNQDMLSHKDGKVMRFLEPNREVTTARNNNLESLNQDILYSQNLIVRGTTTTQDLTDSVTECGVVNFKRFRKIKTQSGNSFSNLVPFSKYPYNDSNYEKEESEYVKEEKRRKQTEAMAEDLFNNERGRRRGVAGSLLGLLSRS
ncbi:hypothetical protein BVRB_6g143500 [Beta vulgaris subsp. vulgaris]|nr:hypothetical protein BVRB_6g143500 [Beta vulgaris subsp. vulgaris]